MLTAWDNEWIEHRDLFNPNDPISRAEAAKLVVESKEWSGEKFDQTNLFVDVGSDVEWFFNYVYILKDKGIINGYQAGKAPTECTSDSSGNYFCPHHQINRAEAVKIIYGAFFTS